MNYGNTRDKLIDLGYRPIPIIPNDKRPAVRRWADLDFEAPDGFARHGVGVACGTGPAPLAAVDIDIVDGALAGELLDFVLAECGETVYRIGRAPKVLLVYRAAEARRRKQMSARYDCGRVELLGYGQQFVAYGVHPDTQAPYTWPGLLGGLVDISAAELPVLSAEQAERVIATFEARATARGFAPVKRDSDPPVGANVSDDYDPDDPLCQIDPLGKSIDELRAMLETMDPDSDRDHWRNVGMALHHETRGSAEGLALWDDWSGKGAKYQEGEPAAQWASFGRYAGRPLTCAYLLKHSTAEAEELEAKTGPAKGFPRDDLRPDRFVETPPPPIEWIIPGLLPRGILGIASGEGGETYKSLMWLDLAIGRALADVVPGEWLGRFPLLRGRSLFCSLEDPAEALHRRIQPMYERKTDLLDGDEARRAISDNLLVLTRETFFDGDHKTLVDKNGKTTSKYKRLRETIAETRPSLVVVDTKSKATEVDENDNALNSRLATACASLCDVDGHRATMILISHVSKAVRAGLETNALNSVRGAGSLGDDARWILWTRPTGKADEDGRPILDVKNAKNSYAPKVAPFLVSVGWPEFFLVEGTHEDLAAAEKKEQREREHADRIDALMVVLQSHPAREWAKNEIRRACRAADIGPRRADKAVDAAVLGGLLEMSVTGPRGTAYSYTLTAAGREHNAQIVDG